MASGGKRERGRVLCRDPTTGARTATDPTRRLAGSRRGCWGRTSPGPGLARPLRPPCNRQLDARIHSDARHSAGRERKGSWGTRERVRRGGSSPGPLPTRLRPPPVVPAVAPGRSPSRLVLLRALPRHRRAFAVGCPRGVRWYGRRVGRNEPAHPLAAGGAGASGGDRWPVDGAGRLSTLGGRRVAVADCGGRPGPLRSPLPAAVGRPWPGRRVRSSEPRVPADGVEVRRWWLFANDVLPGWPALAWDRGTAADLPEFLGDSPVRRGRAESCRVRRSKTYEWVPRPSRKPSASLSRPRCLALAWAGGRRGHPLCGLLAVVVLFAVGGANLLGPPWWQRRTTVPLLVGLLAAAGMVVVRGRHAPVPVAPVAVRWYSSGWFDSTRGHNRRRPRWW